MVAFPIIGGRLKVIGDREFRFIMHDCPGCSVPLHGHEEFCPKCGTKQIIRRTFPGMVGKQKEPSVNLLPIVVTVIVLAGLVFGAAQMTWVGQLMRSGPKEEDPLEKMTYLQARQIIEAEISKGLSAVGSKATFKWQSGGVEADKSLDQPVELTIDTSLSDPQQRRTIIDPIKQYMEKAKIPTLTMNDSKSHATWTYTVAPPQTTTNNEQSLPAE